jgi:hypothetical protein
VPDVVVALAELRGSIAWPDESVDVTSRAVAAIAARPPRRRWPVVAAALVAVISVGVPAAAHLLHVAGVRVMFSGDVPPDLSGRLLLGRPATSVPDEFPVPSGVGRPAAAYEGRPAGGETLVWAPSARLPEVLDSGVGMIITRFPGALERDLLEKRVFAGATVETTTVDGRPAYWLGGGPHGFLYLDDHGAPREDTLRLAGHALLWVRGDHTYRLESSLPRADAVALAESMAE